eukprot:508804-Amorphochlora_amoeboformis.AAC.1
MTAERKHSPSRQGTGIDPPSSEISSDSLRAYTRDSKTVKGNPVKSPDESRDLSALRGVQMEPPREREEESYQRSTFDEYGTANPRLIAELKQLDNLGLEGGFARIS